MSLTHLYIDYRPADKILKEYLDQHYFHYEWLWGGARCQLTDRKQECYLCKPKTGPNIPVTILISFSQTRIAVFELKDPVELRCPKLEREKPFR